MREMRLIVMLTVLLVTSGAGAQTTTASQTGTDTNIALLRSDVQAKKTDIIGHTMQSNDTQAKAFWPLYREYANKQQVIGLQKADAIFTLNWVCTMHTLRALRQLGKRPGLNIPMFSFDDFELAHMLTPGLSVVHSRLTCWEAKPLDCSSSACKVGGGPSLSRRFADEIDYSTIVRM